jgi:hypothetical protein
VRTVAAAALTTLQSREAPLVLLLELGFDPVLYFASSAVSIDHGGNTYLAAGSLGAVDAVKDAAGEVQGVKFALSGVPSANLSLALGVSARNKYAVLSVAILNATTHAIEDVSVFGTFVLDQMPIVEGAESSSIGVTAYPLQTVFQRVKSIRYTDGDQKRQYPGDRCMEFLNSQSQHSDVWPAASWYRR